MFLNLLILSIIVLSITGAGMGIRTLLKSNGRFPGTHISGNSDMIKRGISCAQYTDTGCSSTEGFPGCSVCNGKNH